MNRDIEGMHADIAGGGARDRATFVSAMASCLSTMPLTDRNLVLALRTGAMASGKMVGPPHFLDPESRGRFVNATLPRCSDGNSGRVLVLLLSLDLCGRSAEDALAAIIEDLLSSSHFNPASAELLQRALAATGISITFSATLFSRIAAMAQAHRPAMQKIFAVLRLCGFEGGRPVEERDAVFAGIVLSLLRSFADLGDMESALLLEHFVYSQHIKPTERPDHHKKVFADMEPWLRRLGMQRAARLGPLKPVPHGKCPKVAFLLHNGHRLAHVEVLLAYLEGVVASEKKWIEPLVYLLSGEGGPELAAICARFDVPVQVCPPATGIADRFDRCRKDLAAQDVEAVIFVSLPLHLDYLVGLKLAPVSIWWSMKFPLPNFAGLDGRVFYRMLFAGETEIDGVVWRGGPLGISLPPQPDPADVAGLRAKFGDGPLLGTVAREEKIREPAYLDAVARILQRYPTAHFLWTGRQELPEITSFFGRSGVGARCHFVGWVDPAIYCRAFDLFLETFPLTGLMSGWAMANGMAVVTAGPLGWLGCMLEGIYNGSLRCASDDRARLDAVFANIIDRVPCLWARDADGFVALASALLDDAALRRDFGLACQRFMTTFLSDKTGSAEIQSRHFAKIVQMACEAAPT